MTKKSNIRLVVLSLFAIVSAIFFIVVATPLTPIGNICEDNEYAKEQYAQKDIKKRNKFIIERNKHCRVLIEERKGLKEVNDRIENCTILDSALNASDKYIALKKGKDPKAVRDNISFYRQNLKFYNYCPQYNDVVKKFSKLK